MSDYNDSDNDNESGNENNSTQVNVFTYRLPAVKNTDEEDEECVSFVKPPNRVSKDDVVSKFKNIDFKNCKMTGIEDGTFIFVYAMYSLKTKYGDMVYVMDYDGDIFKTNANTSKMFNGLLKKNNPKDNAECYFYKFTLITRNNPLAVIHVIEDRQYNGFSYKHFELRYILNGWQNQADRQRRSDRYNKYDEY